MWLIFTISAMTCSKYHDSFGFAEGQCFCFMLNEQSMMLFLVS